MSMGKSNQKTVKTLKEPCNKQNYYAMINLQALERAAATLSGDGFKMWVYFSKNQDGWQQQLSSKHAIDTFCLSKRRYDNAIKELIEGGYLVDVNTDPQEPTNRWSFYEKPLVADENKPLQKDDTSLEAQENKASPSGDTRNNTENNTTTREIMSVSEEERSLWEMSERERRDYFTKNVF